MEHLGAENVLIAKACAYIQQEEDETEEAIAVY